MNYNDFKYAIHTLLSERERFNEELSNLQEHLEENHETFNKVIKELEPIFVAADELKKIKNEQAKPNKKVVKKAPPSHTAKRRSYKFQQPSRDILSLIPCQEFASLAEIVRLSDKKYDYMYSYDSIAAILLRLAGAGYLEKAGPNYRRIL